MSSLLLLLHRACLSKRRQTDDRMHVFLKSSTDQAVFCYQQHFLIHNTLVLPEPFLTFWPVCLCRLIFIANHWCAILAPAHSVQCKRTVGTGYIWNRHFMQILVRDSRRNMNSLASYERYTSSNLSKVGHEGKEASPTNSTLKMATSPFPSGLWISYRPRRSPRPLLSLSSLCVCLSPPITLLLTYTVCACECVHACFLIQSSRPTYMKETVGDDSSPSPHKT